MLKLTPYCTISMEAKLTKTILKYRIKIKLDNKHIEPKERISLCICLQNMLRQSFFFLKQTKATIALFKPTIPKKQSLLLTKLMFFLAFLVGLGEKVELNHKNSEFAIKNQLTKTIRIWF